MTSQKLLVAQTGLAPQESKSDRKTIIREFLNKHHVLLAPHNVRAWGSFEVAISFGGAHWGVIPNSVHGWGYSLEDAMINTILDAERSAGFSPAFLMFFGQDKIEEIKRLLAE
jgi:hypothetical protein